MTVLIKNGTVITSTGADPAEVLVDGETIVGVLHPGSDLAAAAESGAERIIDASGLYVIPGGVDGHTHMELPFGGTYASDDFENGTRAAAWGGTTTIVDFAVQTTGASVRAGLEEWHGKAEGNCAIDYAFHQIIGGVDDQSLKDMDALVDEGVTSFKLFMAYPGVFYSDDGQILRAMQQAAGNGALIMMHAENGLAIDVLAEQAVERGEIEPVNHGYVRRAEFESEATHRAIQLAKVGAAPLYIVHLSASEALEQVAIARDKGANVFAETCPQYLYLNLEDHMAKPGFDGAGYVCSTPLRTKHEHHHQDLWKGLRNNDLSVVATDHCPFCMKDQKELGVNDFRAIPNGIGGVEHRMDLIYQGVVNGEIGLPRWVELCATTPARMFGLYPKKGTIQPGADADIVLYDPNATWTISVDNHHMNMDYSAYEGFEVNGHVHTVMSRGSRDRRERHLLGKCRPRTVCSARALAVLDVSSTKTDHQDKGIAMKTIDHLIDAAAVPATSGRTGPVFNPATGAQSGEVGLASIDDVDLAVASAKAAFDEWRHVSIAKRTKLMFNFRNLVVDNADEIAARLTAEHGKVLSDAGGEVARAIENIEFACGLAEHLKGTYSEMASTGVDVYSVRQPLGVVAGITPFNFPAMVPMWMLPNAVACGNTFVMKPSERDPSAPRFIAELFQEAGFPPGVLNVVNGDKVAVDRLLEHPDVKAVSFVGSTPIAKYVYQTGTANGKRIQALGGAKNHMVVLPDADIDLAADSAVSAAYGSAGERCMAISVAVAVGGVADPLVDAIKVRMEKLTIGEGTDPASEMGPLITEVHRDKVAGYIGAGADAGATVVVDGRDASFDSDGFFLGVTLLDHVTPDMTVYTDEIFGPVLSVVRVDTYQEAAELIANNQWGNGAAIFTRDGGAARRFQEDADAGMVGINVPIPVPVGYHSFGGWKDSAFGDTTIYGPEGIHFYTRPKVLTSRWPDPAGSSVNLGFPTNQ